jgi:hypothetical protein
VFEGKLCCCCQWLAGKQRWLAGKQRWLAGKQQELSDTMLLRFGEPQEMHCAM